MNRGEEGRIGHHGHVENRDPHPVRHMEAAEDATLLARLDGFADDLQEKVNELRRIIREEREDPEGFQREVKEPTRGEPDHN